MSACIRTSFYQLRSLSHTSRITVTQSKNHSALRKLHKTPTCRDIRTCNLCYKQHLCRRERLILFLTRNIIMFHSLMHLCATDEKNLKDQLAIVFDASSIDLERSVLLLILFLADGRRLPYLLPLSSQITKPSAIYL